MRIGVPKEIKNHEYRVGLTPVVGARAGAPRPSGERAEGRGPASASPTRTTRPPPVQIMPDAGEIFASAEMIVKVKEPQADERAMLREGQILFTYLHLAPDAPRPSRPGLEERLRSASPTKPSPTRAGRLPLLTPMSEVAGRMAIQVGAHALEKAQGGRACCSAACPACRRRRGDPRRRRGRHQRGAMAMGLGAQVTVLDRNGCAPARARRASSATAISHRATPAVRRDRGTGAAPTW
jgi:alanine dehydrogenase